MWTWLRKQLGIDRDVRLSMNEYVVCRNELHELRQQVLWIQRWVKNLDTAVAHIEHAARAGRAISPEDVKMLAAKIRTQVTRGKVQLPTAVEEILKDERAQRTV